MTIEKSEEVDGELFQQWQKAPGDLLSWSDLSIECKWLCCLVQEMQDEWHVHFVSIASTSYPLLMTMSSRSMSRQLTWPGVPHRHFPYHVAVMRIVFFHNSSGNSPMKEFQILSVWYTLYPQTQQFILRDLVTSL